MKPMIATLILLIAAAVLLSACPTKQSTSGSAQPTYRSRY
jgi:hypothetical protein